MIPGRIFTAGVVVRFALAFALCGGLSLSYAEARKSGGKAAHSHTAKQAKAGGDEKAPESPPAEPAPPPYDAQILRLAEILGALSYLDDLCGSSGMDWRMRMQALIDAEAKTPLHRERIAGRFNRGFQGYRQSYRACTKNARAVIIRFLAEGSRLSHEVIDRYGAS
jgi:uncharacterized protein (TIGR02301 family)